MFPRVKYVFVFLFLPAFLLGNPSFDIRFESGDTKDYVFINYHEYANNLPPDTLFLQMSKDGGETWYYINVIYVPTTDRPRWWVGVIPIDRVMEPVDKIDFRITTRKPDGALEMP